MENQSKAVEFIFQDTQIHFLLGNEKNVMVNATGMARACGKKVSHFLENDSTKKFIEVCLNSRNSDYLNIKFEEDLYTSKQKSGTYFHRILALKFAAWLDPEFELWIYSKIENILFGNAKVAGERISELSIQEAKMKKMRDEIWKSDNEVAKNLLRGELELKKLKNSKIKAVNVFVQSNQVLLFE